MRRTSETPAGGDGICVDTANFKRRRMKVRNKVESWRVKEAPCLGGQVPVETWLGGGPRGN